MLRRLPKPLTDEEVELEQRQDQRANEQPADKNGLRIAFRYNDLPLVNSEQTTAKIGHHFNLMEHMDSMMLYYTQTTVWDDSYKEKDIVVQDDNISNSCNSLDPEQPLANAGVGDDELTPPTVEADGEITASNNNINNNNNNATMDSSTANNSISTTTITPTTTTTSPETQPTSSESHFFYNSRYGRLLNKLQPLLQYERFVPGTNRQKNLCRVCLTSLGSPLWYDDNFASDLLKFLTVLRASVRSCTAVCFITMPMHLIAKYVSSYQ